MNFELDRGIWLLNVDENEHHLNINKALIVTKCKCRLAETQNGS